MSSRARAAEAVGGEQAGSPQLLSRWSFVALLAIFFGVEGKQKDPARQRISCTQRTPVGRSRFIDRAKANRQSVRGASPTRPERDWPGRHGEKLARCLACAVFLRSWPLRLRKSLCGQEFHPPCRAVLLGAKMRVFQFRSAPVPQLPRSLVRRPCVGLPGNSRRALIAGAAPARLQEWQETFDPLPDCQRPFRRAAPRAEQRSLHGPL